MIKTLTVHFTSDGFPVSGLTPTIDVFELHPSNPTISTHIVISNTVNEIGLGWYRFHLTSYDPYKNYVFTFDGGEELCQSDRYKIGGNEAYMEEIADAVWDEPLLDHTSIGSTGFELTKIGADTATISISIITLTSLINTLMKYETNRTKIDPVAFTLTVFDNDCITPLHVFNLRDHLGNPSIAEVCERLPVDCI